MFLYEVLFHSMTRCVLSEVLYRHRNARIDSCEMYHIELLNVISNAEFDCHPIKCWNDNKVKITNKNYVLTGKK